MEEQKIFEDSRRIPKQKYFLLCESCFWSASSYIMSSSAAAANNIVYKKCPVCYEYMIAGLPLSNDEVKCEWGKSGNQDEFSHKKW
ncbi:MAG TPA: hypothetical protein VE244_01815 [Nitrososphaeraceae archaeon]|nr:hypothetical protein [Nitrososphaeraceae archaeon]MCD6036443.1 hypothetical protein [Nitrososphaeraceae archaeon]MDF2768433.1 hypothetical protein [Nitrososphaeraceae archaeon]HZC47774.1 hypothetical protein [Nitrososphaeraceae archaeon]